MKPLLLFFLFVFSFASDAQADYRDGRCLQPSEVYDSTGAIVRDWRGSSDIPTFEAISYEDCVSQTGFWVDRAGYVPPTASTGTGSSSDVVTAIDNSTLSIVTALACLCFFVGLNSWETSAK